MFPFRILEAFPFIIPGSAQLPHCKERETEAYRREKDTEQHSKSKAERE